MKLGMTSTLIVALSLAALPAFGDVVSYPSNLSTVVDSAVNPAGELGFFWSATRGDSITQTFTGTGITTLGSLTLSFGIDDVLQPGNEIDWDVLVNGISVGSWIWTSAQGSGTLNQTYSFAPITGNGIYTLRMAVTNETPVNGGSIGIFIPGTATLAAPAPVPEPVSALLLSTGLLALGIRRGLLSC
jgi:hypothetical protein